MSTTLQNSSPFVELNSIWISKDDDKVYHYHINHSSICKESDIIRDIAKKYDSTINHLWIKEDCVKCKVCKRILKSKESRNIKIEKSRNKIKTIKFNKKYKIHPIKFLENYMSSPENTAPTLKKIRHDISKQIDGINIDDVLSEALINHKIHHEDGKFYPIINGEIIF